MAGEVNILRTLGYFQGLEETELEEVARRIVVRSYQRRDVVHWQGEPCLALHFVVTGRVKISVCSPDGRELILRIARPGRSFNDVAIVLDMPTVATATVLEPTLLFSLAKDDVLALTETHPWIARNALRAVAHRLDWSQQRVQALVFDSVTSRLARVLLTYAEADGQPTGDGIRLRIDLTRQDLAALVGTAREVISRGLSTLQRENVIKVEGQEILILDKERLNRASRVGPAPGR